MKIWLDDLRPPPEPVEDGEWLWCKTVEQAKAILLTEKQWDTLERITEISLDNDLGEGQPEGRKLVLWMAENDIWPEKVHVHSQNPVARDYMLGMIERYKPNV